MELMEPVCCSVAVWMTQRKAKDLVFLCRNGMTFPLVRDFALVLGGMG